MAARSERIESIAVGRNVIVVAGWIAPAPEPAELRIRIDGAEVDAMVEPPVVQGRDLVRFVAEIQRPQTREIRQLSVFLAGRDELPPRSDCRVGVLQPVGYLERVDGARAVGWLYDPDLSLGEHAAIEIDNVGRFEFMPDVERQDVVAAGVSATPLVGFEVSLLPSAGGLLPDEPSGPIKVRLVSRGRTVAVVDADLRRTPNAGPVADLSGSSAIDRDIASLPNIAPGGEPAVIARGADRSRPRVLSVIAATAGGTPQTNLDLMRGLEGEFEPFILAAASDHLELARVVGGRVEDVRRIGIGERIDPVTHDSPAYRAAVSEILAREAIDLVHVRHLAWHGVSLLERAKALSIPVLVSFHDFYAICPTVKLLDERGAFCGGRCTGGRGPCRPELWPPASLPPLKHAFVHQWRRTMTQALALADHFVTTSKRARDLIVDVIPELADRPFDVIRHGRDFASFHHLAAPPLAGERLRIVAPGNISPAKGAHVLAAIAADPRFEVHQIGEAAAFLSETAVVRHGAYARDELAAHIASIRPHIGLVASIWPETYCHTLTEVWASGVPVAAFDVGAIGERIASSGGGWLVRPPKAVAMLAKLIELAEDPDAIGEAIRAVHRLQATQLANETVDWMARHYAGIYRRLLDPAHDRDI